MVVAGKGSGGKKGWLGWVVGVAGVNRVKLGVVEAGWLGLGWWWTRVAGWKLEAGKQDWAGPVGWGG